jgi:drug/metabolite transporter (DMT)-like permease
MSLESPGLRLSGASAWDNAFWLGLFSSLSMLGWLSISSRSSPLAAAQGHCRAVLLSAGLQAASTACFIEAIHLTSVANAQVIFATTPAIAALLALVLLRERTPSRTWLGIAGSIAGILTVMLGSLGQGNLSGDLCALASIISYSLNLTLWRRHPRLNRQLAIGSGGLIMALCALVPGDPLSIGARALLILAALGFVSAPLGRVFVASATRHLPVAQVGLLSPVETVAATTWAWLILDEAPRLPALVGAAIVIVSLVIGMRPGAGAHSQAMARTPG